MTKWDRALIYLVISALVNPRRRTGFYGPAWICPNSQSQTPSPAFLSHPSASLVPALVLLAIYCFHLRFYQSYFPYGDDPALFNASEGNPAKWFSEGFSKYFVVYPEWNVPRTDFLRPGVNFIVRLNHTLFGEHYSLYFATFYCAQFMICVLVVCVAQQMGVDERWLYFLGPLAAINPAFVGEGLYSIAFQFDIWSGLFAVLALYLILREWHTLAVLSLTFAVFTKEPALYAPVAAMATAYLIHRRKLLAVTMLLPLVVWAGVWKFVFVGTPGGNYALQGGPKALLLKGLIQGFLRWPTGIFDYHIVRNIVADHSLLAHLPDLIILLINLFLWGLLLAVGAYIRKRQSSQPSRYLTKTGWYWPFLSGWWERSVSGSWSVTIHDLAARFIRLRFSSMLVSCTEVRMGLAHSFSALAIGSLTAAFLWNAQLKVSYPDVSQISSMRDLMDSLRRYRGDIVYVLNSSRSDAAPSNLASLAGTPSERVVILSEATGCLQDSRAESAPSATAWQSSAHRFRFAGMRELRI